MQGAPISSMVCVHLMNTILYDLLSPLSAVEHLLVISYTCIWFVLVYLLNIVFKWQNRYNAKLQRKPSPSYKCFALRQAFSTHKTDRPENLTNTGRQLNVHLDIFSFFLSGIYYSLNGRTFKSMHNNFWAYIVPVVDIGNRPIRERIMKNRINLSVK